MKKYLQDNAQQLLLVLVVMAAAAFGVLTPAEAGMAGAFLTVKTAAGTVIALSASTPATFDAAGYAATGMTYTAIGEIVDGGSHGRSYATVTHNPIGSRGTQKFKGSYNEGTKTLQLALDSDDAGQIMLKTALAADADYSFKVTYPGGDVDYFQAKVMSYVKATSSVDSVVSATVGLEITTNTSGVGVVEVLAT